MHGLSRRQHVACGQQHFQCLYLQRRPHGPGRRDLRGLRVGHTQGHYWICGLHARRLASGGCRCAL